MAFNEFNLEYVMKPKVPVSTLVQFASGRLTPEQSLKVLDRVEGDSRASIMLEKTIELLDIASEPEKNEGSSMRRGSRHGFRGVREYAVTLARWAGRPRARVLLTGAGVVVIIAAVLLSPLPMLGRVASAAIPTDEEVNVVVRGAEKGEVDLGAHLMAAHRFEDAARVLDWYISAFPKSDDLARANFLSGLTHLRLARKSFLGFFAGINREEVRRADAHFLNTVMLSGQSDLSVEATWYLARAQVLLGEEGNPGQYLELVMKNNGAHRDEAARLQEMLSGR